MASAQSLGNVEDSSHELTLKSLLKHVEAIDNTVDKLLSESMPETSPESVQLKVKEELQEHLKLAQAAACPSIVGPDDPISKLTHEISSNISQLEDLVEHLKAEQTDLQDQQRREEKKKEELMEIKSCLDAQPAREPTAEGNQSKAVKQLEKKLSEAESLCKTRTQQMFKFISEHFPEPTKEEIQSYNKKHGTTIHQSESETLLSMSTIMEQLMNACLETPNDAYISIDNPAHYWPPYIELLERFGIALRHPDNQHQIRLTPYHH